MQAANDPYGPNSHKRPGIDKTGKRVKPVIHRNASNAVLKQNPNPNPTGNLWTTLPSGFEIEFSENNPAIQEQIQWFIQHQGYLDRTTQRAAPYMYLIYDQAKQRGLPTELVLLPIIESAYYPFAYSSAGAAGLWQLMPGTATKFGLKRDAWYDGRRDIFASTTAALDYLNYLGNYFNDNWLLAIAAYDGGEGTIQNAIRRNAREGKPTDFWSLPLHAETRAYVPRLLALAAIVRHPDRYPIKLPAISDQPYLGQVDVGTQMKLKDAADLAGMSLSELKTLNPGYNRFTTDPKGQVHKLLLPLEKINNFKASLGLTDTTLTESNQPIGLGQYRVQENETLEQIAERFHTTSEQLKQTNQLNDTVSAGTLLQIPNNFNTATTTTTVVSTSVSSPTKTNITTNTVVSTQTQTTDNDNSADDSSDDDTATTAQVTKLYHTIRPRETLSSIARHYGVSVNNLRQWNQLHPNAPLKVNSRLVIYPEKNSNTNTETTNVSHIQNVSQKPVRLNNSGHSKTYKVHPGDTFHHIAHRFNMSDAALKAANPGVIPSKLKPGQVLVVE